MNVSIDCTAFLISEVLQHGKQPDSLNGCSVSIDFKPEIVPQLLNRFTQSRLKEYERRRLCNASTQTESFPERQIDIAAHRTVDKEASLTLQSPRKEFPSSLVLVKGDFENLNTSTG